uniref:Integrin alpha-2 domain-containing protein n=1 Tax=Strigamia maritima TaxID=126957 RepID=T1JAL5_STRMM
MRQPPNRVCCDGLSQATRRTIPHCFLCFFVLLTVLVGAFNVDLNSVVIHERTDAAMFGFAVAQHREKGTSWLLVGAPKANTRQPNVTQGGAVFKCSIEVPNDCQEIMFDRTGSNYDNKYGQIDNKSGQWFGATIHSSGINGIVVVLGKFIRVAFKFDYISSKRFYRAFCRALL